MIRLGYAKDAETVIRLMRRSGAAWVKTVPCRYRRGCIVWLRETA